MIRHMLDANAYEIAIAGNGRKAVALFQDNPDQFDVILMDVSMPEMDGHEATRAIREIEASQGRTRTPIVCLTAHVMASDIEAAHAAGMDDYLAKPISKDKLERTLSRWIEGGASGAEFMAAG